MYLFTRAYPVMTAVWLVQCAASSWVEVTLSSNVLVRFVLKEKLIIQDVLYITYGRKVIV